MKPHILRMINSVLIAAFVSSSLYIPKSYAGEVVVPGGGYFLPKPGVMVNLSPAFVPAHLKGITIHKDDALKFDFIVDKGDSQSTQEQKKYEYTKLIKYFLAALTTPDKDQWVNLSPYEKNRIIQDDFGKTEMGRDLLAQDYLLKQITSSLMYPESGLGKSFWDKIYAEAFKKFGNTNIPVNTFNKVWIVPNEAVIYESGNTGFVLKSHLKVMLEGDYLAMQKNQSSSHLSAKGGSASGGKVMLEEDYLALSKDNVGTKHAWSVKNDSHAVASQVIREVILPALEKEVNEGKNFAMLRQVFASMLLATWYKNVLKESFLSKAYADKAKVVGVNQDPKNNEAIYQQYLAAFKKGVYNYIKEEEDKNTKQLIPRKYFAGGMRGMPFADMALVSASEITKRPDLAQVAINALNKTEVVEANLDPAQTSSMDQENSAMNASVKGNIISEQLGTLKDKEIMTINYQGPIIINLAGELILKIMKVSDLDENDRKIINLEVGYAVVDKKGGFKALRDNPSGFISRGHITIKRSGDRIILQDGVEGKSSKNGTIVSY